MKANINLNENKVFMVVSKEEFISLISINQETKVSYVIKTILELINRWNEIKIIVVKSRKS